MKIKLLILDKDKSYLNRIASVFYTKYPDKFEIYTFTEQEKPSNLSVYVSFFVTMFASGVAS